MKNFRISHLLVIVILALSLCSFAAMANAKNVAPKRNVFAEKGFVHILGPSPAIVPSEETAFDDWVLESCDIFKDRHTYYWYYHAQGRDKELWSEYYQIGVAIAPTPLGPWKKYEGNPILEDFGFLGGVVKVDGKFYMYNQYPVTVNDNGPLCVATADKPEGPWKKYEGKPHY